jgi:excisionase family DNA binding protein
MSALAVTLTVDELRKLVREEVQRASGPSIASTAPEVMTRADVAKLLQVHPNVVGRYIREQGLPAARLGGEWRFLRADIIAWLAARKERA